MNKSDLINAVSQSAQVSKEETKKVIDACVDAIVTALANGDKVSLPGFGTFKVADRPARQARNPQTGEPITIPARKAPVFSAGSKFKEAVNK